MRAETETVITWTADDDQATVYSLMPRVWRMCERAGGIEIRLTEGIRDGKKEARTFLVDSALIAIRKPRVTTDAQKQALRANLAKAVGAKTAKPGSGESGTDA